MRAEVKFKSRLERGKLRVLRVLDRIVTVTENGLEYEVDRGHADILMKDVGINVESKGVLAPRTSTSEWWGEAREERRG